MRHSAENHTYPTAILHRTLVALFAAAFAMPAGAQQPVNTSVQQQQPTTPDAGTGRAQLPRGAAIAVEDTSGRQTKARFREWTSDALVVTTDGRTPALRAFALDDIRRVTRDDSRKNGFWIGFAVGTVPGIVFGSLLSRRCTNEASSCPGAMALFGGLTGLAGGGLGAAIDGALYRGPTVFSRQPANRVRLAPLFDPLARAGGAAVSVEF